MSHDATATTLRARQWAHKASVGCLHRYANLLQYRTRKPHCCDQYSSSTSAQLALLKNPALCCALRPRWRKICSLGAATARLAVLQGPGRAQCRPGCLLPPSAQQRGASGQHHAASGMPQRKRWVNVHNYM
jgi:hypothetical protein